MSASTEADHPMTVLVLAERTDTTADMVVRELNDRGAVVFRCDIAEFPAALSLSARLDPGDTRWGGRLCTAHRAVALEDITGVYFRRPTAFRLPEGMSAAERRFAAVEAKMGLGGVLMSLPCRWVNHPSRVADAEYKPLQLVAAARVGLRVPATAITNDPAAAHEFAAGMGGPVVYKTPASPAVPDGNDLRLIYTTGVDRERLDDERIGLTAHLFQRRITKQRDVRVTVVGERVFAVDIHVQGSPRAMLDWRADYAAHRYEVTELPAEVEKRLVEMLHGLGLRFAAVDFVVDAEDQTEGYVLVDVNPNGQWGWLQEVTGLPIAAAIAEELTGSEAGRP
jgi:ATP-grasp ribosomal peptide maturase